MLKKTLAFNITISTLCKQCLNQSFNCFKDKVNAAYRCLYHKKMTKTLGLVRVRVFKVLEVCFMIKLLNTQGLRSMHAYRVYGVKRERKG
jgi:hypothetical protein